MSRTLHQQERTTQTIESIFAGKGYDATKLNALAHLFHITGAIDGIIKSTPTPQEISSILAIEIAPDKLNEKLQENYFQKYRASGERQQIKSCEALAPHKGKITELFRTLGYIDAVIPSKTKYDIAFVYGCAQTGLEERITSLTQLQAGHLLTGQKTTLEVRQVFILTGDRPLWPDSEPIAVELFANSTGIAAHVIQDQINKIFTPEVRARNNAAEITEKRIEAIELLTTSYGKPWPTEADMARALASTMPTGQGVLIVNASGRDGKRPDTLDTVAAWNDKFGCKLVGRKSIIAISKQPYIPEQYVPLGVLDPQKFSFEVVGNGCTPDTVKPELLLTSFAGGFYKELQLEKFKAIQNRHGYEGIYNPNKPPLSMPW